MAEGPGAPAAIAKLEMTPALESHFAKYRKLVPSLALINHLADVGHGPVGGQAMARALGPATYLETHARRAYGAGPEAETAAAKAILSHVRKGDLTDGFTARDIHRHGWSHLADRDQVQAGLNLLCDLDWIRAAEQRPLGGGRPTTFYESTRGHFDDQLSEQIPGDAEDRFWQKAPPRNRQNLTKPPLRSSLNNFVSFVSSQDRPVSEFLPPSMRGGALRPMPNLRPRRVLALASVPQRLQPHWVDLLVLLSASPWQRSMRFLRGARTDAVAVFSYFPDGTSEKGNGTPGDAKRRGARYN